MTVGRMFCWVARTFADEQRIEEPDFRMPPGLRDYGGKLTADNAYYKPPEDGHPGGYCSKACAARKTSTPTRRSR